MGIGARVVKVLDELFNYMPPIEHKQPQKEASTKLAPSPAAASPTTDPYNVHERIANGFPLTPQLLGEISSNGLSPEQATHVLHTSTQATDTDVVTAQLEGIAKKASTVAIGATGSALGAGQGAGDAIAAGASAAVPAIVLSADAAMLGIAAIDMFGGDVSIPTYAPLSPEFDYSTDAGFFHSREEAILINDSLASTLDQAGGTVKFRTSGRLTNDFALGT